jgi:hypothetical protein
MKSNTTRNHAAASLNLPQGWHVDTYPGGNFTFERYDEHGRIVETRNTRDPHETAREINIAARPLVTPSTEEINLAAPNQQTRGFILRPSATP